MPNWKHRELLEARRRRACSRRRAVPARDIAGGRLVRRGAAARHRASWRRGASAGVALLPMSVVTNGAAAPMSERYNRRQAGGRRATWASAIEGPVFCIRPHAATRWCFVQLEPACVLAYEGCHAMSNNDQLFNHFIIINVYMFVCQLRPALW